MSYRDLRNLCEILRAVGYPRLVSVENFRNPNFPLVADISRWLVLQYEPKADIPSSCDTELDRVTLIRAFAEFMLINVQVKLNTKRLYQSDGYAVKEILKVASVLYNAVRDAEVNSKYPTKIPSETENAPRIDIKDLKETRSLTSHLVQKGVGLYDMLSKEVSLREARQQALSKAHEHGDVERLIKSAIETGGGEAKKLTSIIETVQNNCAAIDGKIEKKRMELDRSQKRLLTLKKVRPAFMDEYEELQQDLGLAYAAYVNRFRSLAYLQNQIQDKDRLEQERKIEERLIKTEQTRAGGDDLLSYGNGKGGAFLISSGDEDSSDEMSIGANKTAIIPNNTGNSSSRSGASNLKPRLIGNSDAGDLMKNGQRRVYGSMMGAADQDSDDGSDMILVDGDNSELASEDEDEEELINIQKNQLVGGKGMTAKHGKSDLKNYNGVNNNNNESMSNGAANGGKGYPIDNGGGRSRSTIKRPTTGGRKPPPTSDDDDDDDF